MVKEIRLLTIIDRDAVLYGVMVNNVSVWSRDVPFRRAGAHRPAGPAFVAAAREQETVAMTYAEKAKG